MHSVRSKEQGHTLVELCVCMAILAILGVGIANLMQSGVKVEMIARSQQQQQNIAMQLFTTLQNDLAAAKNVTVTANQLSFVNSTNNTNITYNYTNNSIQRTTNSKTITYPNPNNTPNLSVSCTNPCFQSTNTPITHISLNSLRIVDSNFNATDNPGLVFPIQQTTFSVVNGNTFI